MLGSDPNPAQVLVAADGTSVEVGNTDAEGRLALADALLWLQRRPEGSRPSAWPHQSALTGACVVALGEYAAGVFGNAKVGSRSRLPDNSYSTECAKKCQRVRMTDAGDSG
jgi:leucyl aminopeptidase